MKVILIGILLVLSCCGVIEADKPPECFQRPFANGPCLAYIPAWSYVAGTDKCIFFVYGGCGGNGNRFATREDCEKVCRQ